MNPVERIPILALGLMFCISVGCDGSDTPLVARDKEILPESEKDSSASKAQLNSHMDSVLCLDESFIENLETAWISDNIEPKLAKKGFRYTSSRKIRNGTENMFKNYRFNTTIKVSKVKDLDGETFFSVHCQVTTEQQQCFEESINNSPRYQLRNGAYTKKGLGTYAEKSFKIDSTAPSITYTHRVGKELSLPSIENRIDTLKQ